MLSRRLWGEAVPGTEGTRFMPLPPTASPFSLATDPVAEAWEPSGTSTAACAAWASPSGRMASTLSLYWWSRCIALCTILCILASIARMSARSASSKWSSTTSTVYTSL